MDEWLQDQQKDKRKANIKCHLIIDHSHYNRSGQYKIVDTSLTTSSNNEEANRPTEPAWSSANRGCAAPEVLVNGSPSDTIDGTVSGGDMTSIEEIVFVSEISGSRHSMDTESAQETTKRNSHKRICKIKCLDGLWVGPLCAFQNGKFSNGVSVYFFQLLDSIRLFYLI